MAKLLILSTPRTGSNLLCECLTQSGVFGHVDGFFVGHGEGLAATFDAYSHNYIANHQAANGNFATKIMWDYIDELSSHLPYGRIDEFMSQFTHVLHLYREDDIAQAVSWYMALGSGKWTSENEQKRPFPEYNYRRIAWHLGIIRSYGARTTAYCDLMGIDPLRMSYESFVGARYAQLSFIAYSCGLDFPHDIEIKPTLKKQENPLKQEYAEQFTKDYLRTIKANVHVR